MQLEVNSTLPIHTRSRPGDGGQIQYSARERQLATRNWRGHYWEVQGTVERPPNCKHVTNFTCPGRSECTERREPREFNEYLDGPSRKIRFNRRGDHSFWFGGAPRLRPRVHTSGTLGRAPSETVHLAPLESIRKRGTCGEDNHEPRSLSSRIGCFRNTTGSGAIRMDKRRVRARCPRREILERE